MLNLTPKEIDRLKKTSKTVLIYNDEGEAGYPRIVLTPFPLKTLSNVLSVVEPMPDAFYEVRKLYPTSLMQANGRSKAIWYIESDSKTITGHRAEDFLVPRKEVTITSRYTLILSGKGTIQHVIDWSSEGNFAFRNARKVIVEILGRKSDDEESSELELEEMYSDYAPINTACEECRGTGYINHEFSFCIECGGAGTIEKLQKIN